MERTNNNRRRGQRNNRPRATVYRSIGPDEVIRGTAHQIVEKYEALAHEADTLKDQVKRHTYLQHADHYIREIAKNAQVSHA